MPIEQVLLKIVQELGVVGIFAASFIGASSIFIPIPYHILIFWVAANTNYNIYTVVIAAGIGSAAGEMVGYGAGYAAKKVFSETRRRKLDAMLKILLRQRRIWPLIVFLFALTPLPDDIIFVPLGILHMDFTRVFVPCLFGKLTMFYVLVAGGRYLSNTARGVLGVEEVNLMITVTSIIIFIIILIIMLKIDWEKILAKYEDYMSHLSLP